MLSQVTLTSPKNGAWNTVLLPAPLTLSGGQCYWLALLTPNGAGTVAFRDVAQGDGQFVGSQSNQQTQLTGLPAMWSAGKSWTTVQWSAYAASVDPGTLVTAQ
jgi:hypothetical protein